MTTVTYREAIKQALADELAHDENVVLLGEDIGAGGGVFKVTDGLFEQFGSRRVRDTPIAEQAIIGAAIGAAVRGLRPVAELMFADFAAVCYDQIVNQMAKYRYMTNGQVSVPATVRLVNGAGLGFSAQHSQAVENWLLNCAGLKICVPATPADAYGLLRAAIQDPDPVLFFEHKALYNVKAALEPAGRPAEIGVADIVQEGHDVTLVATQNMRRRALRAAEILAAEGVAVEVVDPRTLLPFDHQTVAESLHKTGRLVVAQEGHATGSWGASLIAEVTTTHFDRLTAAPIMVSGDPTPIPYAGPLEEAWLPTPERIVDAVRQAKE